jgi:hypothetical protein
MNTDKDLASSLIHLLTDRSLGLPLMALVADVIAADARFNYWVAIEGKRKLSEDAMLQTIDVYEDVIVKCRAEIERFGATRDTKPLEDTLEKTLQTLKHSSAS